MLDKLLLSCQTQWTKAKIKRNHPFRYFVLGTVNDQHNPELRTVVLRNFDPKDYRFTIYSDLRTQKIKDLQGRANVEMLFYHPTKLIQIRVKAICTSQEKDQVVFLQQPENAQKDYTTLSAPGTPIKAMDHLLYTDDNFFVKLIFKATQIDYLRLKRPHHQRAIFLRNGQGWDGEFVTP